ncbi:MAG: hypothetical protein QNJ63_12440 [Calothrix sp. MO_192.B10]|nr:hypothetical protein [Calothrix sp. MO_192.B10]
MKNLKLAVMTACVAALMLIVGSEEASARTYYRSCSARYAVKVTNIEGVPTPTLPRREVPGTRFSGRGKCGAKTRLNACRRRARDFCHSCMVAHWASPLTTPTECSYYSGNVGVRNYTTTNLTERIENYICSIDGRNRRGKRIKYEAYRITDGNRGCGPKLKKFMRVKLGSRTMTCPSR